MKRAQPSEQEEKKKQETGAKADEDFVPQEEEDDESSIAQADGSCHFSCCRLSLRMKPLRFFM